MTKKEHLLAVRPNIESDVFSNVLNDVLQAMENYSNEQLILSGVVSTSNCDFCSSEIGTIKKVCHVCIDEMQDRD